MSKTKPSLAKLVESSEKQTSRKQPQSAPPDFIQALLHHPNAKEAAQIIAQHFEHVFTAENGMEIEALKLQMEEMNERYTSSYDFLVVLEQKKRKTEPYIKVENNPMHNRAKSAKENI